MIEKNDKIVLAGAAGLVGQNLAAKSRAAKVVRERRRHRREL